MFSYYYTIQCLIWEYTDGAIPIIEILNVKENLQKEVAFQIQAPDIIL